MSPPSPKPPNRLLGRLDRMALGLTALSHGTANRPEQASLRGALRTRVGRTVWIASTSIQTFDTPWD